VLRIFVRQIHFNHDTKPNNLLHKNSQGGK
jgi:hypothetical protein